MRHRYDIWPEWMMKSPGREIFWCSVLLFSLLLLGGLDLGSALLIPPFVVGALALYAVPTIVAYYRGHKNLLAIAVMNLLFGWTVIGWGILLGWALLAQEVKEKR